MGCIKRNVIGNILTADSWFRWLRIDVRKLQKQDCDYCHFVPAVRVCTNDLGKKKTVFTAILYSQSVLVTLVKRRLVTAILCSQSVSVTLVKRRL